MSLLRPGLSVLLAAAAVTSPARADDTTVVGFESGNVGAWTFGPPSSIVATGGNPSHNLRCTFIDTYAVQSRTGAGVASVFTGDFRARHVTSLGVDARLISVDFSAGGRNMSVMLMSDNGTPRTFDDDCTVFFRGDQLIPQPGQGWRSYDFAIPSRSETMPSGWHILESPGCSGTPDQVWSRVIRDVDQVVFFWGDPELFYIFQAWNAAIDNPRITVSPPPACPCDWNHAEGLDSQDFFDYLEAFYSGAGDFNGADGTDSQDLFDFLECFFDGCSPG